MKNMFRKIFIIILSIIFIINFLFAAVLLIYNINKEMFNMVNPLGYTGITDIGMEFFGYTLNSHETLAVTSILLILILSIIGLLIKHPKKIKEIYNNFSESEKKTYIKKSKITGIVLGVLIPVFIIFVIEYYRNNNIYYYLISVLDLIILIIFLYIQNKNNQLF
jgi:Na+/H+ antiporter NhaD/arsenite permease-like protein